MLNLKNIFVKIIVGSLVILGTAHAQNVPVSKVVFTWSYDFTPIAACAATAPTYPCIQFIWSEGATQLTTTTLTTYTLTPLPSAGTHTYTIVANELLSATTSINSIPVSVTVPVPAMPSAPGNVVVIIQ